MQKTCWNFLALSLYLITLVTALKMRMLKKGRWLCCGCRVVLFRQMTGSPGACNSSPRPVPALLMATHSSALLTTMVHCNGCFPDIFWPVGRTVWAGVPFPYWEPSDPQSTLRCTSVSDRCIAISTKYNLPHQQDHTTCSAIVLPGLF